MKNLPKSIETEVKDLSLLFYEKKYSIVEDRAVILLQQLSHDFRIWNFLGLSYAEQNKYELSFECFREGIENCKQKTTLLNNLSLIYQKNGQLEESIGCLKDSLQEDDSQFKVYFRLGTLFYKLDRYDLAENNYLKAYEMDKRNSMLNLNLSILYKEKGLLDKSLYFCDLALEDETQSGLAHRHYSSIKSYKHPNDSHILKMKTLLDNQEVEEIDKVDVYFGLAKALEDCRDFEASFGYLKRGNDLYRSKIKFSLENQKLVFDEIKNFFKLNAELTHFNKKNSKQYIFVVGMPRSGTSLIEQVLSSHSEVQGGGELKYLMASVKKAFSENGSKFPLQISNYHLPDYQKISSYYEKYTKNLFVDKKYLIDKMPYNFLLVGFIKNMFPNSKIILSLRDPIENCFSIYKQKFKVGNEYAYKLEEIGEYYLLYRDLVSFWESIYPDVFYKIQYEELIANQEKEIRRLLEHCCLDWEDSCLQFHKTNRIVKTASAAQVRSPIYSSSVSISQNYNKNLRELKEILNTQF